MCCASGPSFTEEQAQLIDAARSKIRLAVVNRNWERFPDADLLYAADPRWWQVEEYGQRALREFRGECWTCMLEVAQQYGLCHVKLNDRPQGLPVHPDDGIDSGGNSGNQLLGLVYKLLRLNDPKDDGPLIMVGYDLQHTNGRAHHHSDYTDKIVNGKRVHFSNAPSVKSWIPYFEDRAREFRAARMRVVNCTRITALQCFPRADLAETLAAL